MREPLHSPPPLPIFPTLLNSRPPPAPEEGTQVSPEPP